MTGFGRDARYALRTWRRSPGFTAVGVLSLALGIGANTAIFSLLNTVVLRNLSVQEPERLVQYLQVYPNDPRGVAPWTLTSFRHFSANSLAISELSGTGWDNQVRIRYEGRDEEKVLAEYVLGNYFPLLGLKPAIGRLVGEQDETGAVLNWAYWKSRFQQDPGIVGKALVVMDKPVTVIGVAPRAYEGFQTGARTDIWIADPHPKGVGHMFGRLKPGATIEQARAEAAGLYRFTIEERAATTKNSEVRRMTLDVEPAAAGGTKALDRFGRPLQALMALAGAMLLIACINMAGLLLARAAARQREMAIRRSVGAGRWRLARQVLTESVMLSAVSAALGVGLAYFMTGVLVRILASGRPHERMEFHVQPDLFVLLFTAAAAVGTGLLFGLAPAIAAGHRAPMNRTGETRGRRGFGRALVITQVASSAALLCAAALYIRQLTDLRNLDLGFQRERVLLVTLDAARGGYQRNQLAQPYQELLARLKAIPGVRTAAICGASPIQGAAASAMVSAEGFQERPEERRFTAYNLVSPRYFEAMGTPLLAGRDFEFADISRGRVAIVNRALASYYFAGRNPVGKHLAFDGGGKPYEIIGVAADAKYTDLKQPAPRTFYLNMFQEDRMYSQFVIRTNVDPASVSGAVRRTMGEVMKTAPIEQAITMEDQVDAAIVTERLVAVLAGLFSGLGSLLAALGLYGLLAYTVARRTREIGVRMALGATGGALARLVVGEALALTAGGLVLGVAVALRAGWPVAAGASIIAALGLAAAYAPAARAARVDPIEALRQE